MNRATPEKINEQSQLAADVQAFLANGGEIKTLPGFGMAPKITEINGSRIEVNTVGRDNSLSERVHAGIRADLLAGMGTVQVARRWNVGTTTVTRRKDQLQAEQERV